jgi:hypothetical protein
MCATNAYKYKVVFTQMMMKLVDVMATSREMCRAKGLHYGVEAYQFLRRLFDCIFDSIRLKK